MKKILLLTASAVLLLASCQKSEVVVSDDGLQEISFSAYGGREVTKADPTTLTSGSFNVAAYYRASSETTHSSYFTSQKFSGTASTFSSSPVHYWPVESGVVLDFYAAYEPEKETSIGAGETYEMTASTGDVDFMAATLEGQSSSSTHTLAFGHKLTKVGIKIKGDVEGLNYSISDLTMKANSKATYKWFSSTASEKNTWTEATISKSDYDFVPSTAVEFTQSGTNYTSIPTVKYLLPKQPTSANSVTMTIKYQIKDGSTVLVDKSSGVTIDLTGTTASFWGINKSVIYTLTLNASSSINPIEFTASQGDWTSGSEQSVTVQ